MNTNLVQMKTQPNKEVWSSISTFLERASQNSENTKKTYERAIRNFFKTMRNKTLEDLSETDIVFEKSEIKKYQIELRKQFKSSTVNNRMASLKKCYSELEDDGFNVNARWFDLERYSEVDSRGSDSITFSEFRECVKIVSETRKGLEKALFIELAFATAFRKESLRTIKFKDFFEHKGQMFVRVVGKGQKVSNKPLSDELYQRILEYKKESGKNKDDKVFDLTKKTIDRMMREIRNNIDFGDRYITFHSLKKASVKEKGLQTNNDLKAMQAHADHSSANTTVQYYMDEQNMDNMVALDTDYRPDSRVFENMSKDELLDMILNSSRETQIKLLHQIEK